ncbi:hypothetical protein VHEMI02957 [[Torrubiella] hemipterigena]|uniref:enoyl-[acyl-carrier-protein] reductase n=1 Tax=[Torrubiella] hemipterigena TaxID=1531966 RepID=A0A0A1T9E8_9HYPO|nr:hypothetical protein VHEMI02957 [[Torrubiella] hemipterigena]
MTNKRDTIITYTGISNDPASVIQVSTAPCAETLAADEVLVEFIASPINPQDLLVISGKYPVQPSNRHEERLIPGYDGICQVVGVGAAVSKLCVGDRAIPLRHGLGTWRSSAIVNESLLIKVPENLDPVAGCVLKMGAMVAACLLRERPALRPGDWIIQNAGGSTIATMVSQLARMSGVKTCSIIRDRPAAQDERRRLLQGGADAVVTESELEAASGAPLPILQGKRVVLGLDSVFGESGTRLVGQLTLGATYINYGSLGGMDKELRLTQQDVFWKRITFRNFRLSEWTGSMTTDELQDLLQWLSEAFVSGQLRAPAVQLVDVSGHDAEHHVQAALRNSTASSGCVGTKKSVLVFRKGITGVELRETTPASAPKDLPVRAAATMATTGPTGDVVVAAPPEATASA